MTSVDKITSQKKIVEVSDGQGNIVTKQYLVWNATVANLTLMALGSSAPEILLAVLETVLNLG